MPDRDSITREFLSAILVYDPETGEFRWKPRALRPRFERTDKAWNTRRVGTLAGTVNFAGYVTINLLGIPRFAHRLAFIYMTGGAPKYVDHINRIRTDNRWANLRGADCSYNAANARLRSDNTSGYRGVTWYAAYSQWLVRIDMHGRSRFIGYFNRLEDAAASYEMSARELHGEFFNAER